MNVVITGASRGIGFDLANIFLQSKNVRVLAISNDVEGLSALANVSNDTSLLRTLTMDHLNFSIHALEESVVDFEGVDILVNNAGIVTNKPFTELDDDEWQQMFQVNFFSTVQMIKILHPKLLLSKSAHIVNIGSMGGFQGSVKFPGLSAYSASKAALSNLTESLAVEFQSDGIAVNCLCPGSVNTQMFREAFPSFETEMESAQMAAYIHHFACTGHHYYNGKVLPVSLSTP